MSMISELIEELIDNADSYTKELHDLMYRAANTIEMLSEKAREPKQGEWTPCSEGMPKRDGDYLVTFHHKWPNREYKTVEVEEFRSGGFDENLYMKIIAWMPLPKPYKESE